jgi:hypothetical protein
VAALGDSTWADWDHRGRLVIAREGALLAANIDTMELRMIADFNRQIPDAAPSPADARRWPLAAE